MRIQLLLVILVVSHCSDNCRFAKDYEAQQLLRSSSLREQFVNSVLRWEAKFVREIGVDSISGLTMDGQQLDFHSGLPKGSPHLFTASSKECIHIALLTKVLDGSTRDFYTIQEALELLKTKLATYQQFGKKYPGYGGFLPWLAINPDGVTPTWDWTKGVPALDNGELFWAVYGLVQMLEETYSNELDLILGYTQFYQTMIKNAEKIFYEGDGKVRSVASIENIYLTVEQNNYGNGGTNCENFDNPCFLDDPYEGELFVMMMYLFSSMNVEEKSQLWLAKRAKLQAVDYYIQELNQNVTVQKGWWFSAHEQWKYLLMPYKNSELNYGLFLNGEKVRTWNARQKNLPGMFASVTSLQNNDEDQLTYLSGCGIQEIAFEKVTTNEVVTPYSTMTLFLAEPAIATIWYHNMISGPGGQTQYGSIEALHVAGKSVSPVVTWDTKMTTVIGMLGGIQDIVARRLKEEQKLENFVDIINKEWSLVFGQKLNGQQVGFALPLQNIPQGGRKDFTTCQRIESVIIDY